jgi:PAS domain S-box-containing protein
MYALKKKKIAASALKISLVYLLLGVLWITLSDKLMFSIAEDAASAEKLGVYKGWFFIIMTAFLLYILIRKSENLRAKLEYDLAKSNEHWQNIFESANDPVLILDKNYNILSANNKAEEIYGYSLSEFKSLNIKDLRSPETRHLVKQQLEGALTPSGIKYELAHLKKNGAEFPVEISTKAVVREGRLEYVHIVHDLTERKKIENELVESEKKYRGLVETTHDLVWVMDKEGRITYVNEAAKDIFGYSPGEMVGKSIKDLVAPADVEERTKVFEQSIKTGEGKTQSETRAVDKDGNIKYLLSNSYVTRDTQGNVTGLAGTSIDITARVEAENRVKYLNRVYAVLSNINQLIIRANDREKVLSEACRISVEDGKFKLAWIGFLNEATGKIEPKYYYGSNGYLESLNISINEDKTESGPIVRAFKEGTYYVCNNIESDGFLKKWKDKSLEQGFRSFAVFPIKIKHKTVAVYNIYSDNKNVFEEQETALLKELAGDISFSMEYIGLLEDIKESRARFEGIVSSAMDAIITIDSNKNIVLFNSSAEIMFRHKSEEVTGKKLNVLIPARFHEIHNEHVEKFGKSGTTTRSMGHLNPLSGIRKNGEEFPIEASISQIEIKGEKYYTAIVRDVTLRMQNEKAINESNERLHALAAHLQTIREDERTSVAREIHDQLGQELTALKMDISFLRKRIEASNKSPDWDAIFENLKSMSDVADQTINSVRKIARELRPDLLDKLGLREAIEWHTEEFEKRTGIKYGLSFPDEEMNFGMSLNTTIFRILQESLTNVARHSGASEVSIGLNTHDRFLHLEIADNGRGITEDEINNTKSLGLVGIRERAYSAGGELKIEGKKDTGTLLKIIIPLRGAFGKYD